MNYRYNVDDTCWCKNMDETQNNYAELKTSHSKNKFTLYDSKIHSDGEQIS